MANKYSEELFGAVDAIVKKRLEELNKDSTILCSIEDNSEAADGKYTVLNNALRFTAYSENVDYPIGQNVWVLIPDGDYNNTKIIIGKYVSSDTSAFNWVDPFKDFADMTGNLAVNFSNITEGLIANDPYRIEIPFGAIINEREINVNGFKGLNRIAISADFATYFSSDNPPISGDYGLRIDLITDRTSDNKHTIELNASKMNGNVYGQNGIFFEQKMVYDFDPEEIGNVQQIYLTFYQNKDFIVKTGGMYNISRGELITNSNDIFIKNIKVMLGYSTSKIRTTTALLSTFDSTTYNIETLDNRRNLIPRFAYKNGDGSFTFINTYEDYINAEKINPALRNLKLRLYYRDSQAPIEPRAGQFYRESWEERPYSVNEEDLWRTWDKIGVGVSDDFEKRFEIPVKFGNSSVPSESVKIAFCFKKNTANLNLIETRFKEITEDFGFEYTENDLEVVQLILLNAAIWYSDVSDNPYGEITSPYYDSTASGLTDVTRYFWNYIASLIKKELEKPEEERAVISNDFGEFHPFACKLIQDIISTKYDYIGDDYFKNFDKAKYILENVYTSDALVFVNEASTEEAVADLLQGLQLTAIDAQAGVYNLYKASTNANSELIKMSDTNVKRNIQVSFTSYTTGEEELGNANRIYWLIPKTGTMIKEPAEGISYGENYNIVKYTLTDFEKYIEDYNPDGMRLYVKRGANYLPIGFEEETGKIFLDDGNNPPSEIWNNISQFFADKITDDINNIAIFYMKSISYILVGSTENLPETINSESKYVKTINKFIEENKDLEDNEKSKELVSKEEEFLNNNYNTYWIIVEDRWETTAYSNLKKSSLAFQIKSVFRKSLTNNKIFAAICRNGKIYPNSIELFFGVKGTNDADYTLSLIPVKEVYGNQSTETAPNVWTVGSTQSIQLNAILYDSNDKVILSNFDFKIIKGDKNDGGKYFSLDTIENVNDARSIKPKPGANLEECGGIIIECVATPHIATSTNITQYYILPLRTNRDYSYLDGPDIITYDANKVNPEYYNVKYAIRDSYDNQIKFTADTDTSDGIKKEIIVNNFTDENDESSATDSSEKLFLPTLTEDGYLVPTISYVEKENYDFYIEFSHGENENKEVIWKQPILVTLNNYTNSLIDSISNDESGKGKIRDKKSATASSVMSVVSRNPTGELTGIVIGSLPEKILGTDGDGNKITQQRNGIIGYDNDNEIYGLFDKGNAFIKGDGITISTTSLSNTSENAVVSRVSDKVIEFEKTRGVHTVLAGPSSGSNGVASFRELVAADIPPIDVGNLKSDGTIGDNPNLAIYTNNNKEIIAGSLAVTDPEANGTSIKYISTISQNSIGKITATKATIPTATDTAVGLVKLIDSINSSATDAAATANSVKSAYDRANSAYNLANNAIPKPNGIRTGDIIYFNNNVAERIGIGTSGQVLKVNNNKPTWADLTLNDVGINNWTGSQNITTVGTLTTGSIPWSMLTGAPSASNSTAGIVKISDDSNSLNNNAKTIAATTYAVSSVRNDLTTTINNLTYENISGFHTGVANALAYLIEHAIDGTGVTINLNNTNYILSFADVTDKNGDNVIALILSK